MEDKTRLRMEQYQFKQSRPSLWGKEVDMPRKVPSITLFACHQESPPRWPRGKTSSHGLSVGKALATLYVVFATGRLKYYDKMLNII